MSSHLCGGHCCKSFTLPFSPGELARLKESVENGTNILVDDRGVSVSHHFPKEEVIKIADMVIFQEFSAYDPQEERNHPVEKDADEFRIKWLYSRGFRIGEDGQLMSYKYTCKNFNAEQGLCMVYDDRPMLCRNFPSQGACHYKKCQGSCSIACVEKENQEHAKNFIDSIKQNATE